MKISDRALLSKIQSEIADVACFIQGQNLDSFTEDSFEARKLQKAVIMSIINIAECIRELSEELKKAKSHIPWDEIRGLRHISAHRYDSLRMPDIWEYICEDFPLLQEQIEEIIESEPADARGNQ